MPSILILSPLQEALLPDVRWNHAGMRPVGSPVNARVLAAAGADGLRARIAEYVTDDRDVTALLAAARPHVVRIAAPATDAASTVTLLRAVGATAALARDGAIVVAATALQAQRALDQADEGDPPVVRALISALAAVDDPPQQWRARDRTLHFGAEALVMGIVNATPDSFYDRASSVGDAVERTRAIVAAGGAIVDVGGRSYAHWNTPPSPEEERDRVVPVVKAIVDARIDVTISIDTVNAAVAEAALAAGAHLINDCSGLGDPAMAAVVAKYDAGLVVMHLKGDLNRRDETAYGYADVMDEVVEFLRDRIGAARAAGVADDAIAVDPGLEFGKDPATDLIILDRFAELAVLGRPLLFASSRKSFIGRIFGRPARELLIPSLGTAALGIVAGARILRVHDVAETVQLARMMAAVDPARRAALPIAAAMPETPAAGNSNDARTVSPT